MAGEFRKTNERCTPRNMILFIANQQQLHEKQIYCLWSKRNRSTSHSSSNSSNSIGTCSFKLCGRHIQKYHEIFPSKTRKEASLLCSVESHFQQEEIQPVTFLTRKNVLTTFAILQDVSRHPCST